MNGWKVCIYPCNEILFINDKRIKLLIHATTLINFKNIILGANAIHKTTYCIIPCMIPFI
jgi:hypothetical protein